MNLCERDFYKLLLSMPLTDYIVRIKLKYSHEKEYEYTNELLLVEDGIFVWENDWFEGQDQVEFLGMIAIEDVDVPSFGEIRYSRWWKRR